LPDFAYRVSGTEITYFSVNEQTQKRPISVRNGRFCV
jgi:hypothetical protein